MDSAHSTKRFSTRVEFYLRARPKYPAALLHFFQTELNLTPAQTIADIRDAADTDPHHQRLLVIGSQ